MEAVSVRNQVKAGSMSSMVVTFVVYPFDIVIMRLQVMPPTMFRGPVDCLLKMLRREGLLSVFKGLASPLANSALVAAVPFAAYAFTRNQCTKLFQTAKVDVNYYKYITPFIGGGSAGLISACLSVPSELMKTQLGTSIGTGKRKTLSKLIKEVYNKKGIKGFFTGLKATIIRDVPGGAIWYGTYFTLSQLYTDVTQKEIKSPHRTNIDWCNSRSNLYNFLSSTRCY